MIPAIISGMYMGEIIGFSLSGSLVSSSIILNGYDYGQWPSVFYVFGFMGVLWFPFWAYYAHESPAKHPTITAEEVALINEGKAISSLHDYEASMKTKPLLSVHEVDRSSHHIGMVESHENASMASMGVTAPPTSAKQGRSSRASSKRNSSDLPYALLEGNDDHLPTSSRPRSPSVDGAHHVNPLASDHNAVESSNPDQGVFTASYRLSLDNPAGGTADRGREISMVSLDEEDHRLELARRTPWNSFFTHPVSLTLFINSWAFGWIGFTLLSEMPSFLTDELGFNLSSAGVMCVFPYLALFLSTVVFGKLFNYLQDEYDVPTDTIRQMAEFISLIGASVGLLICGFLENSYAAYCMLIVTQVSPYLLVNFLFFFNWIMSYVLHVCYIVPDGSRPDRFGLRLQ